MSKRLGPRSSKDYAPYIEAFTRLGGQVERTGSGHLKLVPPNKEQQTLIIATSPRGDTALKKLRSMVRRLEAASV